MKKGKKTFNALRTALLSAPDGVLENRKFLREITNGLMLRSARLLLISMRPSNR